MDNRVADNDKKRRILKMVQQLQVQQKQLMQHIGLLGVASNEPDVKMTETDAFIDSQTLTGANLRFKAQQ